MRWLPGWVWGMWWSRGVEHYQHQASGSSDVEQQQQQLVQSQRTQQQLTGLQHRPLGTAQ